MATRAGVRVGATTPQTTSQTPGTGQYSSPARATSARAGANISSSTPPPTTSMPSSMPASSQGSSGLSTSGSSGSARVGAGNRRAPGYDGTATTSTTTATTVPGTTPMSPGVEAAARAAARSRVVGSRLATSRLQAPTEIEVPAGTDPSAVADVASGRATRSSHSRRPSQQVVEKEKKRNIGKMLHKKY